MGPLRVIAVSAVLGCILLSRPLAAQADTAGPRAVADSFFKLVAAERFLDAARLMDLEAFDAHRRSSVELARHPMPRRRMSASEFMKYDPKMPRAVAEYSARQFNERTSDRSLEYRHEFGVSTLDSVATLPVEQLAARLLASRDVRTMLRESLRAPGARCAIPAARRDSVLSSMHVRAPAIFGVVTRDSTAWVLYDPGAPFADEDTVAETTSAVPAPRPLARGWVEFPPSWLPLRRVGNAWKVGPVIDTGMSIGVGCDGSSRSTAKPR